MAQTGRRGADAHHYYDADDIPRTYINSALGVLLALRITHAELGMFQEGSLGMGRPVGYYGTQAVLASLAGYTAYLIKSYWQI